MNANTLYNIDNTLDLYANRLPEESLTFQAIMREAALGEIAEYARSEGLYKLAYLLEQAENEALSA